MPPASNLRDGGVKTTQEVTGPVSNGRLRTYLLDRRRSLAALVAIVAVSCGAEDGDDGQAAPPAPQQAAVANTPAPPPTTAPPLTAAPAPTAAAPAAPTAPATAASITHFQVAGDRSLASYTTREKFFNQPSPVFVTGMTAAITGNLNLDRTTWQPAADPPSVITVDLRTLKTDSSRRDNAIRGRFLESDKYPLATFVLKQVAGVPQSYQEGTEVTVVLEGELTVREITKPVSWQGTAQVAGNTLTGKVGTSELLYADFGIPQITIRILAVENWFKLDMELTAVAQ